MAVADPGLARVRSRMGAYPLYGGPAALENALHDSGATAVVVIGGAEDGQTPQESPPALTAYLESHGAVDVLRLRVTIDRSGEASAPQSRP